MIEFLVWLSSTLVGAGLGILVFEKLILPKIMKNWEKERRRNDQR